MIITVIIIVVCISNYHLTTWQHGTQWQNYLEWAMRRKEEEEEEAKKQ
jgi:hypothetical protein